MKKKVLLIQPTPYDRNHRPIKRKKLYFVGLALPQLAALTSADWEVEIIMETIEDIPWDTDAGLIGISSMGHGVLRTLDLAQEFKKRGKTVALGGYMVSLMPEEAKKYGDAVVIGDAEGVWAGLLQDWTQGQLKPFYKKELISLNGLPLPRYDLVRGKKIGDFLPVQAGRGCPNACSFCSVSCLYRGKYLKRNIEEVIRDIQHVRSLGFKKFLLLDDNIAADEEYMLELAREIKKLKMSWLSQCALTVAKNDLLLQALAESGCQALSFGLESITRESLNQLNKAWADPASYAGLIRKIRRAGIEVSTEMVVGADGDTLESIGKTAGFIEENKIMVPRFYILTPIPGTDFFSQMEQEGRIINRNIYSYNGTEAVHVPAKMSARELTDAYWDLYNKVFSFKSIIKRTLLNRNILNRPLDHLFYFLVNLVYRKDIKKGIPPNII
ncbi:B12-binding domain-containing radical SAM protein [Candidatus Formimonas warabiya]|uniref:B12-binding domain-containing radical SAM protein n=1 Tax=Formimonas warabiya TaxID=1761012 RepID=A0A3G1KSA9_FORW1|nr:radical SAM protein [Candidatus Formimonas warabiya]ATW25035.1 B12-binding domain-containing radical SAM protein [Candidatus Formimonas warabiya]